MSMIYYSHVNEDNQIEWQVMNESAVHQLFAIAGSGERVIALLDHPALEIVHIIDINPFALYLTELKIVALRNLSVGQYLSFTGFADDEENIRWHHFMEIRAQLSQPCQDFWTSKRLLIQNGICHCGHFEIFLSRIRPLVRALMGKKFHSELSNGRIVRNPIFHWRWALVKFIFSLKLSYRLFGMRDPAFVSKDALVELIPAALQKTLDEETALNSCLFQLVFKGHLRDMTETELPPSFQKTNLERIQTRLYHNDVRIEYHCADILDFFRHFRFRDQETRFYSLSDILSSVDYTYLRQLITLIHELPGGESKVVFRSFIKNRLDEDQIHEFRDTLGTISDVSNWERTKLYQVIKMEFNNN